MKNLSNKQGPELHPVIQDIYSKNGLTAFLKGQGLRFTKALGQNFLHDKKIMRSMIDKMDLEEEEPVIEIGPGVGHLTWQLIERGHHVIAIEKDKYFIDPLRALANTFDAEGEWLTVIEHDAAEVDYQQLLNDYNAKTVIGNLPYYAVIPILFQIAYSPAEFSSLGFLMQKEVGERILAQPGTKEYSRISIVLNYLFKPKKLRYVPPSAFIPRPKVDSMFMKFNPKENVDKELAKCYMEPAVKIGFSHRRKKLRSQMKGSKVYNLAVTPEVMEQLEQRFNLDERAQDWDVTMWLRFAEALREIAGEMGIMEY